MNISRENKGELSAYLKLELVPQDYEGKVAEELKRYRRKVSMHGFRPGQVPLNLVKKMYGQAILMEQINKMVAESIDNYIKENKINILGHALPVPEEEKKSEYDFENPGNFTMWFEIGLAPEFNIDLAQIKSTEYHVKATEEQIDKHQESICRRYGMVSSPETAGAEDTLGGEILELDGNGELKEGGIQTKTSIAIDLIADKGIQEQFIGKKTGDTIDFEIHKAFTNKADLASMLNIKEEELDNISPKFRFRIDSITHVEPAVPGEDLYAKAYPGVEIKDEAAFREQMRKEIEGYYKQHSDKKLFVDTVDKIIDSTEFNLPMDFIKRWVISETNREAEEKKQELVNDIPEEELKQIERSLRWDLIQNKLSSQYEVKIEVEDLREFYKERVLAQYFPIHNEDEESKKRIEAFVDSMMKNQEEVKRIYDLVFEEKLTALFREKTQVETKDVNMDEFVEILKQDGSKKA